MSLQQRGQTQPGLAEELGGDPGVEDARGAESVLVFEEAQIVIGVVEHELDLWIGEQGPNLGEVAAARGSMIAVSLRVETWMRYIRSWYRWKLAASVSMAARARAGAS